MKISRRKFIERTGIAVGSIPFAERILYSDDLKKDPEISFDKNNFRDLFSFPDNYYYLNTSGIGAVPDFVIDKMYTLTKEEQKHPKPGHDINKWEEVKKSVCRLIGDMKTEELALLNSTTEGINAVLNSIKFKPGDEIITTTHEHPALHIPLLNLIKREGVKIKYFDPLKNNIDTVIKDVFNLITKKTKLIFVSHVTCTTGQILPVGALSKLAGDNNILLALDGAQSSGVINPGLYKNKVDFYAFSGHKWILGPKRTGGLFIKQKLIENLLPATTGAYSDAGYNIKTNELKLQPTAQRFEYGTQNDILYEGMKMSADLLLDFGKDDVFNYNKILSEIFYKGLKEIKKLKILSPSDEKYRSSIISFKSENITYKELAGELMKSGFRVRQVHEADLDCVRASFHLYNTKNDVNRLLNKLEML